MKETTGLLDALSKSIVVTPDRAVKLGHPLDPLAARKDPRATFLAVLRQATIDLVVDQADPANSARGPLQRCHDHDDDHTPRECIEEWWFSDEPTESLVSLNLIAEQLAVDVDRLRALGCRALAIRNSALAGAIAA